MNMTHMSEKHSMRASIKHNIDRISMNYRLVTGQLRVAPDFIIIGAQRCGTTSLYNTLANHPFIAPALKKEIHFFDVNFRKGLVWYKAHFPLYGRKYLTQVRKQNVLTGEASPYYIFHPHVPKRIAELLPQVKLIALLRNPVDRAYSHYHHEVRKGFESLSFEDAIEREQERLRIETVKMLEDENYYSFNHRHYSYLSRGIYVDQLRVWMRFFSREQILILKSEDFYEHPPSVIKRIVEFLRLPYWNFSVNGQYSYQPYSKMDITIRKRLIDYFDPYNQELYEYLSINLGWNT